MMSNSQGAAFLVLMIVAMIVMWYLGYTLGRVLERRRHIEILKSQIPNHYQAQTGPSEQLSSAQLSGEKLAMDAKEAYRRREEVRTRTPDWKDDSRGYTD